MAATAGVVVTGDRAQGSTGVSTLEIHFTALIILKVVVVGSNIARHSVFGVTLVLKAPTN